MAQISRSNTRKSREATLHEKAAAWRVTATTKARRKMNIGVKRGSTLFFRYNILLKIMKGLQKLIVVKGLNNNSNKDVCKSAVMVLGVARAAIKKVGVYENMLLLRVIL